jgi:Glycosyltransferase family 10 (fucosyltransferase) C-term
MKLYILTPFPDIITYNNYMNIWFKMNDWTDAIKNNKLNIDVKYIYIDSKIDPNYEEDYLLVADILSQTTDYYEKNVCLFKKENRFVVVYECLLNSAHRLKFDYIIKNFSFIFQNSTKMTKKKNVFWIPCYNYFMKHEKYSNTKDKFCCVSPIYDLGFSAPFDPKRVERVKIIQQICQKDNRIHIYGPEKWKEIVPLNNFIGKLPNEEIVGIRGEFSLEEKIRNKCEILSQYKFVFVFENIFIDGFITEKLIEALYSDSIVIYYGPSNIKDMYHNLFNQGVINGHDYNIDEILSLMNNMNQEEYNERVCKIKSLRDRLNYENSSENIKNIVIGKVKEYIKK